MLLKDDHVILLLEEHYTNSGTSDLFQEKMPEGNYLYAFSPEMDLSPLLPTSQTHITIQSTMKFGCGAFIIQPRSKLGKTAQPYRYIIHETHPHIKALIQFAELNPQYLMIYK